MKIPPPIKLSQVNQHMTFHQFVTHLLDDTRFNDSGRGLRASMRIDRAVSDAKIGESVDITKEDYDLLKAVAEAPSHGYPQLQSFAPDGTVLFKLPVGRQLVPFLDAISGE